VATARGRFYEQIMQGKCPAFKMEPFNPRIVEEQGLSTETVEKAWGVLYPCWESFLPKA
jgi:hypothetical protein